MCPSCPSQLNRFLVPSKTLNTPRAVFKSIKFTSSLLETYTSGNQTLSCAHSWLGLGGRVARPGSCCLLVLWRVRRSPFTSRSLFKHFSRHQVCCLFACCSVERFVISKLRHLSAVAATVCSMCVCSVVGLGDSGHNTAVGWMQRNLLKWLIIHLNLFSGI